MFKYFFYYILIFITSVNISLADNQTWNKIRSRGLKVGKLYEISSGTGFFITPSEIVTSAHVVENCLTISVRGAVNPASAFLLAQDIENDLALLTTDALAPQIAYLRSNIDLRVGENLFIIGYPNNRAHEGILLTKQAQL
ncbi:hypothetical protein NOVO_04655 [Rickettsiales bacterium Ac37b]|nr:hypothetical protein NOVO_04655 [Rickettsiales bacterium Ac37b]